MRAGLERVAPRRRVSGFTFIGLMIIVTLLGIGLMAVGEVWHFVRKREKEQELLFVGSQFRQAIKSYYLKTPGSNLQMRYPGSLEDLIKDPRFPSTVRHLRKIYADPFTGKDEWGLMKYPNGGIYGVYSLSEDAPVKQQGFRVADKDLIGKQSYTEWHFAFLPVSGATATQNAGQPQSITPPPALHPVNPMLQYQNRPHLKR